ncbi:S8 family serine peptidase [Acidaminobacter hydrogenoformans]|uniref:Subtilase family protein n=1 Tax=Acidaminobacter hydrogenoformans DSM 2784 TaxID=1120920 RepID=A0A1G5RRL9_9FIRM|nr:S8 family serine peptidase [Acidaminobacter hydrogenoformans]SCZ76745.1 Subtilase family protein [Acidaminobacter hydrogenoformans DSM 2784]
MKTKSIFSVYMALLLSLILVLTSLLSGASYASGAAPASAFDKEKAAVLIAFHEQPGRSEEALIRALGGEVRHTYHLVPAMAATLPQAALDGLRHNPKVALIEPDLTVHALEDTYPWGITRIGADLVHQQGNTGDGIKVGIIDTGLDKTHPDLAGKYAGGYDFVNNDADPMDDHGHGTHVAGTIAAVMNDAGLIGAAPDVSLYALKVLGADGSGALSGIIAAVEWCVDNDIQITNNSYGILTDPGATFKAAFDAAYADGVLQIAAAGNDRSKWYTIFFSDIVSYPAWYASVVAVAATDSANKVASFSSFGPSVELSAPGVSIESTIPGGAYATWSGTSMATPHVVGAAALVMKSGVASAAAVRERLQITADDLGPVGRDRDYGFGLVDADEAALSTTPDNVAPSVSIASPVDGAVYTVGDSITFTATASDPEDGDLTGAIAWSSNRDGALGTGGSFSLTTLSVGTHEIVATVTDSGGLTGSDLVGMTVKSSTAVNTPPVVTISSPSDGYIFNTSDTIAFRATALDAEDGDLTDAITWSISDGTNTNYYFGPSWDLTLPVGYYTGIATVSDSEVEVGFSMVQFEVEEAIVATISVSSITYQEVPARANKINLEITVQLDAVVSNTSVSCVVTRDGKTVLTATKVASDGKTVFTLNNIKAGTYVTQITNVTAAGYEWDGKTPANQHVFP